MLVQSNYELELIMELKLFHGDYINYTAVDGNELSVT